MNLPSKTISPEQLDLILLELAKPVPAEHSGVFQSIALSKEIGIEYDSFIDGLRYLIARKFVVGNEGAPLKQGGKTYPTIAVKLSSEGRVFISRSSFGDEAERELKEAKRQHNEHISSAQQVQINEWLLKTKWWPLIISILSLIVAIMALFTASK